MKHCSVYKALHAPPKANKDDTVAEEDKQLAALVDVVHGTQHTDDPLCLTYELAPAEVADTEETCTAMDHESR